jgi:hypothetical protein
MIVTKPVDLALLQAELAAAGVTVTGLGLDPIDAASGDLHTFDADGASAEMPPGSAPVVDAHVAPPRVVDFAGQIEVSAKVRTTDAAAVEIYRLHTDVQRGYQSTLTLIGIDAGNGAVKSMEGRFVHKRLAANAVQVGAIVILADIHDTAAASWAPNATVSGTDVIFTVAGAAGRNIDWIMGGTIITYAPGGLEA